MMPPGLNAPDDDTPNAAAIEPCWHHYEGLGDIIMRALVASL